MSMSIPSRLASGLAGALIALAFTVGAAFAEPPEVAFDQAGGDAWGFNKRVAGRFDAARCEQIVLRSPLGTVLAWSDDGRFEGAVRLQSGANRVQAECRRDGSVVGVAATQEWRVAIADRPRAWVRVRAESAAVALDAGRSERAESRPAPLVRYEWGARDGNPAPLFAIDAEAPLDRRPATGESLRLRVPAADGEYYVTLRVTDARGRSDASTAVFRVERGRVEEVDLRREHPAWVDEAVLYGIAPFFFGSEGYAGVAERLDEIAALGATAIWLSPVTATPDDDFGYAVTDHFRLRDTFGSEAEFRALVEAAHARGLKVLMDFVPNHFSDRHRYHLDAQRRGQASPYHDWFERGADGEITRYFDWDNLKNLDYDNPEVRRYVTAAFSYWMEEYGIDGFRVDASWAVRERAPEFWPELREELKRVDPDIFLLAEASAREPYHVANGFDAAYDWTDELGEWAWHDVFVAGRADLARLRAALTNDGAGLPDDSLVLRFLNNNDTGERFVSRHGAGLTRVAAALSFTLPGVPLVYNGDEVGAAFEPYDEGPPIVWRDRHGLTEHYARLAQLRANTPALRSREMRLVGNDRSAQVLSFLRPGRRPGETVLVVLNFADATVRTRLAPQALAGQGAGPVVDLFTGEPVRVDAEAPVLELPPFGIRVLRAGA